MSVDFYKWNVISNYEVMNIMFFLILLNILHLKLLLFLIIISSIIIHHYLWIYIFQKLREIICRSRWKSLCILKDKWSSNQIFKFVSPSNMYVELFVILDAMCHAWNNEFKDIITKTNFFNFYQSDWVSIIFILLVSDDNCIC